MYSLELANLAAGNTQESSERRAAVWLMLGPDICAQLQQSREPQRIMREEGNFQSLLQSPRETIEDHKNPPFHPKGKSVNAFLMRLRRMFQQSEHKRHRHCKTFWAGVKSAEFEARFDPVPHLW